MKYSIGNLSVKLNPGMIRLPLQLLLWAAMSLAFVQSAVAQGGEMPQSLPEVTDTIVIPMASQAGTDQLIPGGGVLSAGHPGYPYATQAGHPGYPCAAQAGHPDHPCAGHPGYPCAARAGHPDHPCAGHPGYPCAARAGHPDHPCAGHPCNGRTGHVDQYNTSA